MEVLKLMLRAVLCLGLGAGGQTAIAEDRASAERPNIVLIMADDMGFDSVGSYGATSYETPNIDRLASQGMQFDRAYATPLCTNTRLQLMTAYYNNRNFTSFGILDPDAKTIGHFMSEAGYTSLMAGKWQLQSYDPVSWPGAENRRGTGMHPRDAGFDEFSLYHTGHTELKGSRYANPVIETNDGFLDGTKGKYGPDIWANTIIDFIDRKAGGDKPFFVYYAMALPHGPFVPTPDSEEWATPELRLEQDVKFYGDMVEYADKIIGQIMDHLDRKGLSDNTLVLFYSDNGTHPSVLSDWNGITVQGGKSFSNQQGMRVPLIARWPGKIAADTHSGALVDSTDFIPTLLQAAKAQSVPHDIDGKSFLPVVLGKAKSTRDWVFLHHETRPGYDKDRFYLIRLALDESYKLYEDGRMFAVDSADIYEEVPMLPEEDTHQLRTARLRLQGVLDSMKPYRHYDPSTMPRPDFAAQVYSGHRFDEYMGLIVIEAERGRIPRDESWHEESFIPGYSGMGYVRSLRDQPKAPTIGVLEYPINVVGQQSEWSLRIRHRFDHADADKASAVWVKIDDGEWSLYSTGNDGEHRGWQWTSLDDAKAVSLTEGKHVISLAPFNDNLEIDKLALVREGRLIPKDLDSLPQTPFHPWFVD